MGDKKEEASSCVSIRAAVAVWHGAVSIATYAVIVNRVVPGRLLVLVTRFQAATQTLPKENELEATID